MVEQYVQVAPDSTGAKLRTRERTIGANVVEEQYVILSKDPVVTSRSWCSTFRIPNRVASHPIFTIWNGHATNILSVRRLSLEAEMITATAQAAATPTTVCRLYRITAAPTGGAAVTRVQQDTNEALGTGVTVLQDATADGTSAATALAATVTANAYAWVQLLPRLGAAGSANPAVMSMIPDDSALNAEDPIFLRPSQGLAVRYETVGGTAIAAAAFNLYVKAVIGEFTIP